MCAIGLQPMQRLPAYLHKLARRYGPIAAFRLPWRQFCFINDADLIREVLVTQQQNFLKPPGAHARRLLLGKGSLTGEEPHRERRVIQPAFFSERIERYTRLMEMQSEEFVANIPSGWFDMHAAMTKLTLNIASKTLFGIDVSGVAKEVSSALREIMEEFPLAIGPFANLRRKLPLSSTRRFERARQRLERIVFALIAEHRRRSAGSEDGLGLLMGSRDSQTATFLTDAQIRDEAMTLFLASYETMANALTWTWYLLARDPAVALRLPREGDAYAQAVLNESLRLYPPAWIVGRYTREDVVIGPYHIPKGTTVLLSPLVTQRSRRYFHEPHRFTPERWLQPRRVPQFAFFPFGGGARRIGEQFALTEALIILRTVSQWCRFEHNSSAPAEMLPLVTLRPKGPVWLRAI